MIRVIKDNVSQIENFINNNLNFRTWKSIYFVTNFELLFFNSDFLIVFFFQSIKCYKIVNDNIIGYEFITFDILLHNKTEPKVIKKSKMLSSRYNIQWFIW